MWKELIERPTCRKSVESYIYSVDCLMDIFNYAKECGEKEFTFKIYENGNIAFVFENGEIEITGVN